MNTEIKSAIARSISHNEIVRVIVADIPTALAEVNTACEDFDHAEENPGENGERREDVWGTIEDGSEFRLRVIAA
jgi:hypothetical protein